MSTNAQTLAPLASARLSVSCILVEPMQIWFHCPRCQTALTGFFSDPRGQSNVVCQACGEEFDISAKANLIIV
jgi:transcription elongation factor Elf1